MTLNGIFHFATSLKPLARQFRTLYVLCRANRFYCSLPSANDTEHGGVVRDKQEFSKWRNGGGTFHKSARIDTSAWVEVGAVVHGGAVLGANVHVGSGAVLGPEVTIGHSTKIGYNVSLSNCSVGHSCVIHSGVCIGQDGFGFFLDDQGTVVKKPQLLRARVGDHVEIGANTCIDRGRNEDVLILVFCSLFGDAVGETVIGDHSKIDNLVQIGHNVIIGKGCMLCGQVGIAGSAIGNRTHDRRLCHLGGRAAVRDHISIVSKVRLAANSCVTKDITEPGDYGGFPAIPIRQWRRQVANHYRMSRVSPTDINN